MGKKPFIRFIGYYTSAGNFPRCIEAAPRAEGCAPGGRRARPGAHWWAHGREALPLLPQNPSCSSPRGVALGSCWGIASLLAAYGPGKASVCSPLERMPPFWGSILLFDRFWGGGVKQVPALVVLLEGPLCHDH